MYPGLLLELFVSLRKAPTKLVSLPLRLVQDPTITMYDYKSIEAKWQAYWKENKSFAAEDSTDKPKYYVLDMFPYPSGAGLHVGHPLGYIATDIVTRYKRLRGFNVLHPMGFDSFGLPAEQYAVQMGVHPAKTTETNTTRYREQLELLGLHYDPNAWLRTSDPDFYRWTQWIFIRLFEHWYDHDVQKARPIKDLVAEFEQNGNTKVNAATDREESFTAVEWKKMNKAKQSDVLMDYRIAYSSYATVNWCPALGTVLANDEVKDGRSERGNHPVERKLMRQWMLRITAYSDRLLNDLDQLDWSDSMKAMQANWIGRSEGARIKYAISGHEGKTLEVFTTRPDTLYGNTFMVLAPELELVQEITTDDQRAEVEEYVEWAKNRTERERQADTRKTGKFTGAYAVHPLTGNQVPIWISDYVLAGYGTGAIMAVPAHDQRDWEFAHKFGLEIKEVIKGGDISKEAYVGKDGIMVNSGPLNDMKAEDAIPAITAKLVELGVGFGEVTYRMRDAIWSRQRYWGDPTPIIHRNGVAQAVSDGDLPLKLPHLENFKPSETGEPPLSRADKTWRILGDGAERDLNTMPGAAGSSWYFFRYFDNQNTKSFADFDKSKYWLPVDLYVGGTEHAVGHLLYSRFWTKFLYDLGLSPVVEPFNRLVNQGMIQGVAEKMCRLSAKNNAVYGQDAEGNWAEHKLGKNYNVFLSQDVIEEYPVLTKIEDRRDWPLNEVFVLISLLKDYGLTNPSYLDGQGIHQLGEWRPEYAEAVFVTKGGYYQNGKFHKFGNDGSDRFYTKAEVEKMSKSKFNVINPDDVIADHGTDTFRMFEMFLGPLTDSKPWDTQSINGVSKFLRRVYDLFMDENDAWLVTDEAPTKDELKLLHKTIKKVEEDIERLSFNTAVAAFMDLVNNNLSKGGGCHKRAILEPLVIMLSPYAPHLCEELWEGLGHKETILKAAWPKWEQQYVVDDEILYPVQVNGKVRAKISASADASKQEVEAIALSHERIVEFLEGKAPKKVIVVPKRIVNIVL